MNTIKPLNPFVIGKYESEEFFCDRQEETATLKKHVVNGRHVSLISPRKLPSSSSVQSALKGLM